MAKYATIDEYIGALAEPLATTARQAREVIDANEKVFADWLRQAIELERAQV